MRRKKSEEQPERSKKCDIFFYDWVQLWVQLFKIRYDNLNISDDCINLRPMRRFWLKI